MWDLNLVNLAPITIACREEKNQVHTYCVSGQVNTKVAEKNNQEMQFFFLREEFVSQKIVTPEYLGLKFSKFCTKYKCQ